MNDKTRQRVQPSNEVKVSCSTVTVRKVLVGRKQMTLSLFRQIPEMCMFLRRGGLKVKGGSPWGVIRYNWKDSGHPWAKGWILWEFGGHLYRMPIGTKPSSWMREVEYSMYLERQLGIEDMQTDDEYEEHLVDNMAEKLNGMDTLDQLFIAV